MTATYVPPMTTYHCPDCAVEWKAYSAEPCWLCKGAPSRGACRDHKGEAIAWNSFAMVPVQESA